MKSFLIVEDSRALSKYCEFLINARFKDASITCAHNGQEALEKIRGREYSVILSDIEMPIMDGIEFYKTLKNESPLLAKKLAFISSSNIPSHLSYIMKEDCPFAPKPFKPQELYNLIDTVLTRDVQETID